MIGVEPFADASNLLHIEGNWDLVKTPNGVYKYPGGVHHYPYSIIIHHCKAKFQSDPIRYFKDTYSNPCEYCGESPPEAIQTLWVMHNWDNLPDDL